MAAPPTSLTALSGRLPDGLLSHLLPPVGGGHAQGRKVQFVVLSLSGCELLGKCLTLSEP
jgi:hypothetical protein